MLPPGNNSPVIAPETYGWDSVFAIRLALFDRLIPPSPITAFTVNIDFCGVGKPDTSICWAFGQWQATAVYGAIVQISAPLVSATLAVDGGPANAIDANCQVAINLVLCGQQDRPDTWASVKVTTDPADLKTEGRMQYALLNWFATKEAWAIIDAIFEPLQIDRGADGASQWARPQTSRLAGTTLAYPPPDEDSAKSCGIAFLAKTLTADATGARLALSPYAVAAEADGAYIISSGLLLSGIIAPALARAFGTSDKTAKIDFSMSDDVLVTNTIPLTYGFEGSDGKQYQGAIATGDLKIRIEDDALTLTFESIDFDVAIVGVQLQTIKVHMVERLKVELVPSTTTAASMVLVLVRDGDPVIMRASDDTWVEIGGEALLAVVAAVVAALLNKFLPGALEARYALSPLAARLFTGLIDLLAQAGLTLISEAPDIMKSVELGKLGDLPTIEQTIANAVSMYELPVPLKFKVLNARIASGLVVDLAFATD